MSRCNGNHSLHYYPTRALTGYPVSSAGARTGVEESITPMGHSQGEIFLRREIPRGCGMDVLHG